MMNFIAIFYIVLLYLWNVFLSVDANAMLKPSHRGTMWTRTNFNSAGYNYMGINCGGISRFKQNNGKCGLCGDPYNGARKHETGGKYATGAIADVIDKGQRNIYVKILLNSDQGGYFEFHLCVTNGTAETQACFDKHLLKISEGRHQGDEFSYYVNRAGIIPLTVEVPDRVYCERCVLQWKYVTGNTFGRDEHGVGCLGCGHQETYINCADITIKGWEIPTTPSPPTTPIPTTVWWTTTVAPTTPRPPPPPTTTTTPVPTTRALSSTAAEVVQMTKNTHFATRYATKQRRPATDFDEGSRRRGKYARYPNAYDSVPAPSAPKKSPAVVPGSIFRSNSLESSKNRIIAAQPQSKPIVPKKVETQTVENLPKVEKIKPSRLPKRQSGPFKIPRPPRLTIEQINALNNNKNVQPGHDPLQKYVDVGSSRIVAAVDFTTVRSQQVATPPTALKLDNSDQRSTDSTVNINDPAQSVPLAEKTSDVFNSFGSEMMGAPTKSPAKPIQSFGTDLINEYGIIPSVSPKGNFVRQNKDMQKNRVSHSNGPTSGNTRYQNSQVSSNSNNRHISYESKQGRTYSLSSQLQEPSVGSSSFVSSRYGILQQKPQDHATLNVKQPHFPDQSSAMHRPENYMFGVSGSQNIIENSMPNKNSFNSGIVARYGQIPNTNSDLNLNNYKQNNYQQQNLLNKNPTPRKTTKLPVVDTFTHKAAQNRQSPNIAPWRNQQLSPSSNVNTQDVQDKPVNLFKGNERNKFKAPVVFERFTNYQVGGSRRKPNSVPESLIKANQLRQQGTLQKTAVSNESLHLNTGIHSPEQYFGQDHYIAKDKELSHQAFGGPNSPDYQSGQVKPVQVQANWQSQQEKQPQGGLQSQQAATSQGTWPSQQETQLHGDWQSQQATQYLGGWQAQSAEPLQAGMQSQNNWQSNTIVQQQGGWHTQENPQTFENFHLNTGLHSPSNYFPQFMQQAQDVNIPNQQKNDVHQTLNVHKSLWDPNADPFHFTTTKTTTTLAPTTTTTKQPTTQAAPTTDVIQYQLNELKKLREKMERIQILLLERNRGTQTKESTSLNPTQISNEQNNYKEGVSQATIVVPRSFNKKAIYVDQQNGEESINNNKKHQRAQDNSFIQKSHQSENIISNQYDTMKQTSTVPPGMTRETTKYINHLKTQMLQSIKKANKYKREQMSLSSEKAMQNKQNDVYDTKPYGNDKMSYVTQSIRDHGQQPQSKLTSQQDLNKNYLQQQNGVHTNPIEPVKDRKEDERRQKYKRILQLLFERRKQKAAEQRLISKTNSRNEQSASQYKTDTQRNNQQIDTPYQSRQNQLTQTYISSQKSIAEQSIHHKPALAEMHINSVKKEKIVQEPVITSVQPVETIQQPATKVSAETTSYKPNAVKTTIDKLADRLAASMAEKLSSTGKDGVGNFHVLPLSSDSVMSALRNIAAKILKGQKNQSPENSQTNGNHLENTISKGNERYKRPTLNEVHITKDVERHKIVYGNDQTTKLDKNKPTPLAAANQILAAEQKQVQTSTNGNVMSPERLARRKALIRKMKQIMLRRRQRLQMNTRTKTGNQPIESSQVRPTDSSNLGTSTPYISQQRRKTDLNQFRTPTESRQQQTISNSQSVMSRNRNTVHKIGDPESGRQLGSYADQSTQHDYNRSPVLHNPVQQTSQQTLSRGKQKIVNRMSPSSTMQYSNNNQNESNKAKVRMSPDIARSMLTRVRSMLAKQKNKNGGAKNIQAMSNKDVLVMPLNKEMLFKLLQSMKKKKESTGR